MHSVKNLPFSKDALKGISAKTNDIHHDKLYKGYVEKRNDIEAALESTHRSEAAATYSEYRELKLEETYNAGGQILHELYFESLGGTGQPRGPFVDRVELDFGSWEAFLEDAVACAMASRGWMVTAWDPADGKIHNFLADAHNQGGVWGAVPLWVIDCYEHAYLIDHGTDRKAYVQAVLQNVNWDKINERLSTLERNLVERSQMR